MCVFPQVDEDVALDQAVKFCQIQLATSAQRQVNVSESLLGKKKTDLLYVPRLPFTNINCLVMESQESRLKKQTDLMKSKKRKCLNVKMDK